MLIDQELELVQVIIARVGQLTESFATPSGAQNGLTGPAGMSAVQSVMVEPNHEHANVTMEK